MEATIIRAKCKVSKESFYIRAEKQGKSWFFTWAFKLSDRSSKNEGYDNTNISGSISLTSGYPGCPNCSAKSFTQCGSCKKIACYIGNEEQVTCPHCGYISKVSVAESFDGISGGQF
jgi:hypothetical protein